MTIAFPTKDEAYKTIPPASLLRQVVVSEETANNFLYGGYVVAEGIKNALALIGRPLESFARVLDFGCSCSRVLRWYERFAATTSFFGCDINEEAVIYSSNQIRFAKFAVNNYLPPLTGFDGGFDLIYGISVVTHLNEEMQLAWLEELHRLLTPGGILLLSVHGEGVASAGLSAAAQLQLQQHGHYYQRVVEDGGVDGLPDFYQVAYHSRSYIERVWSQFFTLRAYLKHGPMFLQDTVVLEKPGASQSLDYIYLDLPVGCLGAPKITEVIEAEMLKVNGWAFHEDGGTVEVDLWLDDQLLGSCQAKHLRADVGEAFPLWPSAKMAGFSETFDIAKLDRGIHQLNVMLRTNRIPSVSGYFFKE
ncbi:MAG: class I SAM-dependent methyltransferase [Acidobacteria bacterium]|nr:class I SAM-dependent methyltransferase [Acidobacteriota bacterium]